jgi:hypothetical protein
MAVPMPSAARTSTTTPARTTVLRRTVMSLGSSFATATHGTWPRSENDEWRLPTPGWPLRLRGTGEPQKWTMPGVAFPYNGEVGGCASRVTEAAGFRDAAARAWVSLTRVPGTIGDALGARLPRQTDE